MIKLEDILSNQLKVFNSDPKTYEVVLKIYQDLSSTLLSRLELSTSLKENNFIQYLKIRTILKTY